MLASDHMPTCTAPVSQVAATWDTWSPWSAVPSSGCWLPCTHMQAEDKAPYSGNSQKRSLMRVQDRMKWSGIGHSQTSILTSSLIRSIWPLLSLYLSIFPFPFLHKLPRPLPFPAFGSSSNCLMVVLYNPKMLPPASHTNPLPPLPARRVAWRASPAGGWRWGSHPPGMPCEGPSWRTRSSARCFGLLHVYGDEPSFTKRNTRQIHLKWVLPVCFAVRPWRCHSAGLSGRGQRHIGKPCGHIFWSAVAFG